MYTPHPQKKVAVSHKQHQKRCKRRPTESRERQKGGEGGEKERIRCNEVRERGKICETETGGGEEIGEGAAEGGVMVSKLEQSVGSFMSWWPTGDASWFPPFCAADAATEPTTQLVPRYGPEHLGPDLDAAPHGNSVTGLKRVRQGATLFRDGQVKHVSSLYEPPQAPFFFVGG